MSNFINPQEAQPLVHIDSNCEQERGGDPTLSNAAGKSYGCSVYDLSQAPQFETDEELCDWLHEQEPYLKEWGPSEEAAIHNARLACERENLTPGNPFTRQARPLIS